MASRVFTYLSSGTASDLVAVGSPSARTKVTGWSIYNSSAAVAFVNLYWGNGGFGGGAGKGFSGGADFPTVDVDSPNLSIAVPATSNAFLAPQEGLFQQGSTLWMTITTTAATSGTHPVFSGSVAGVMANIFYEQ